MKNLVKTLRKGILVLLASGLVNCSPTVSFDEVYKAPGDSFFTGSQNLTVEQTAGGMKVTGSEVTVEETTNRKYELQRVSDDEQIEYEMLGMVLSSKFGFFYAKAQIKLGEDSEVSANLPASGFSDQSSFSEAYTEFGMVPGAPGSENIHLVINGLVGETEVAGLSFREEVTLNVWENRVVELDKKGIVARDAKNQEWISSKVNLNDTIAVLMVRN